MKNIFKTILFLILSNNVNAQQTVDICGYNEHLSMDNKYFKDINNVCGPFIGIWKWVNGNQTFKVTIFKQEMTQNFSYTNCFEDKIFGYWEMIENEGLSNQVTIYKSNSPVGNSNGDVWPPMIFGGGTCDGVVFKSMITDNCIDHPTFWKNGTLVFTKISGTNTAEWKVSEIKGMKPANSPSFRIPTDIIMTKQ